MDEKGTKKKYLYSPDHKAVNTASVCSSLVVISCTHDHVVALHRAIATQLKLCGR